MRFRTPKIHSEERNWSVILNPLRSEFDKKRVADKISNLFRLSFEEARELVESTPVILLDELTRPLALQAQGIFQEVHAEISLTNDALVKRRCYRAVWPEPPSLSFLETAVLSGESREKSEEETPIGTVVEAEPPSLGPESFRPRPSNPPSELERRCRELEELCKERDREVEELRRHQDSEKEIPWEERYANLKEEYQEAKTLLEEKILVREKEFEGLRAQLKEIAVWQEKAGYLERQAGEFLKKTKELESAKDLLEQAARERSEELAVWREKYHTLAQKSERFESLYEEERKRREKTEEEARQSQEAAQRTGRELEIQKLETERLNKRSQDLEENQKRLERDFIVLNDSQAGELKRLREENRDLGVQLDSAQRQVREFMLRVEQQELIEKRTRLANDLAALEARLRELILDGDRLRQEIQDRELQAQTLSAEQGNLERQILEVKQAQRHLLEQSKMKEKPARLRRTGPETESLPGG